jgi:DNA-binding Lrp family transcriptional regulator
MDPITNGHTEIDGYILIQARSEDAVEELATRVSRIPGVVRMDRVSGPYDLIAEIRESGTELSDSRAAHEVRELDGVLRALSMPVAQAAGHAA